MKTVTQAAAALGIKPTTARRWIRHGILRAIRMPNGHYRIHETDIVRARKMQNYTLEKAGEILNLSPETIRRRIAEGSLAACQLGGRWFVDDPTICAAIDRELRES